MSGFSFPFDTSGAKDFFRDNRNFGRHYAKVESLASSFSPDEFEVSPATKLTLDVKLSQGSYLLLVSYGFTMSGTNRNFASRVEQDGAPLLRTHLENVAPSEMKYQTRCFGLDLLKDEYQFSLLFGPSDEPAIAEIYDASMTIWRAF